MSLRSPEIDDLQWRKARRSANNGACVEVTATNGYVIIRDTMDRSGPSMEYSGVVWRMFVTNARVGQFDLDHL